MDRTREPKSRRGTWYIGLQYLLFLNVLSLISMIFPAIQLVSSFLVIRSFSSKTVKQCIASLPGKLSAQYKGTSFLHCQLRIHHVVSTGHSLHLHVLPHRLVHFSEKFSPGSWSAHSEVLSSFMARANRRPSCSSTKWSKTPPDRKRTTTARIETRGYRSGR